MARVVQREMQESSMKCTRWGWGQEGLTFNPKGITLESLEDLCKVSAELVTWKKKINQHTFVA